MRACVMSGQLANWYALQDLLVVLRQERLFFDISGTYFEVRSYIAQENTVTLTLAGRSDIGLVFCLTIYTEETVVESLKTALTTLLGSSLFIAEVAH